MTDAQGRRPPKEREWINELTALARVGGVAVIHSNVHDLILFRGQFYTFRTFLKHVLGTGRWMVYYNRALGFTFGDDEIRSLFERLNAPRRSNMPRRGSSLQDAIDALEDTCPGGVEVTPASFLGQFEKVLFYPGAERSVALVVEYAETLAPAAEISSLAEEDRNHLVRLLNWAKSPHLKDSRHIVLLMTGNAADLQPQLLLPANGATEVTVPLPDYETRREFIEYIGTRGGASLASDIDSLAAAAAGLNLVQIDSYFKKTDSMGGFVDIKSMARYKSDVLKRELGELIEVLEPAFGLDGLGGLAKHKEFFRGVADALTEGHTKLVPRGITMMGPPGVGKTALAEALAKECQFNFVKIVNPREKWVGQSERNFRKVLQTLRALAPVVVVEDEADQSEPGRDHKTADSGVTSRLRQMRFEFTGDPRLQGKVLWVRITNRPDLLDMADLRSGRSSERIPFFLPGPEEMRDILAAVSGRHEVHLGDVDLGRVADSSLEAHGRALTGADLEEIVLKAFRFSVEEGAEKVEMNHFEAAVADFIPPHGTAFMKRMEEISALLCSSRRFLPSGFTLETVEEGVDG